MSEATAPPSLTPTLPTSRIWWAVTAMFALNGALFGIWASRIPSFKDVHGLDHATLGMLLLLLAGGAIVSFPIAGRFADRHGAASLTRWLAVANFAALLTLALAPNVASFALAVSLFGASHGGMDVTMNAWGAEAERRAGRSYMPVFHAMWSLGAGIGALSGTAAVWAGTEPMVQFALAGGVLSALALILARIPWQATAQKAIKKQPFSLPKGPLLFVGLLAFCSTLGEGAMADWSAVFLRDVVAASEGFAAMGYAVFSAAMVTIRLSGAMLTRLFGAVVATRMSGGFALIGVALVVGFATPVATLVGLAFLGLGYGLVVPLAFSRAANDPDLPQAQAIARVATLSYGGMLLGPPIIGFLAAATDLRAAFGVLGLLAVVTVLLAPVLKPPAT